MWILDQHKIQKTLSELSTNYDIQVAQKCLEVLREIYSKDTILPSTIREFTYPKNEPFNLYDFQKVGLNYLNYMMTRGHKGELLNMDTGTGKTVTSIVWSAMMLERDIDKVVVFAQSNMVYEWKKQFERFSTLNFEALNPGWSAKKREEFYKTSTADIWIINYEKMRTADFDPFVKALRGKHVAFIMDEMSAKLKNRTSQIHKQFAKLKTRLKPWQYGLTATPIYTSPINWYNIWRLLDKDRFGNVGHFERDFTFECGAKDEFNQYLGFENTPGLRSRVSDLVYSVSKNDPEVAKEFPDKQEILIELELTPQLRKLYDKVLEVAGDVYQDRSLFFDDLVVLNATHNLLRGLCLTPGPWFNNLDAQSATEEMLRRIGGYSLGTTPKEEMLRQRIENVIASGEKICVFSQWTNKGLLPLANYLKDFEPLLYHGGMSADEKDAAEEEFKYGEKKLMLLSDAGKEGLNFGMIGYLDHFDTPPLYAWYKQRSDRIHRIDSTKDTIFVTRYMYIDTVEERIEETMQSRREMDATMGLGAQFEDATSVFSQDQLEYILFGN